MPLSPHVWTSNGPRKHVLDDYDFVETSSAPLVLGSLFVADQGNCSENRLSAVHGGGDDYNRTQNHAFNGNVSGKTRSVSQKSSSS